MEEAGTLEIGLFLKSLRVEAGITQEELAEKLGVVQPYVSQVERGVYSPSWRYLVGFANAVGTSVVTLLRRAGLIPNVPENVEEDIAELISQVPEFAQIFDTVREITKEHPDRLQEFVRLTEWFLARARELRTQETESGASSGF